MAMKNDKSEKKEMQQPDNQQAADQKGQASAQGTGAKDADEPVAHTVEMETLQAQRKEQAPSAAAKTSQKPAEKEGKEEEAGKKSSTVELKVVQQKKKELEDRLKSQGTIRLRPPISGSRTQGGAEQQKQTTTETYKADQSAGKSAAEKTEPTTMGGRDTVGGAKRTLKIKSGAGGGKTMKVGAGEKEKGTMKLSADQMAGGSQQRAAGEQFGTAAGAAGPGAMAMVANIVAMLAGAVTFVFLLLYFLDLYN